MSTHLRNIYLAGRGSVINLKFQLYKLREDKRNLSFHERRFPQATSPQGRLASFSNHRYGDWPLAATPISLTFRTKAFLDESEDLVSLDTPHIVFPRWHHRDGESCSRAISSTKTVTSLRSLNISRFVNKESDLGFVRTYIYHPVDRGFVIEPRIIVISFSSI